MAEVASGSQRLVGRSAELATLVAHLDRARDGEGSTVLISGEPGSGKTALSRAAAALAPDFLILWCRGMEAEVELPYSGLHALLRPLLRRADELSDAQRRALLSAVSLGGEAAASPIDVAMATLLLTTGEAAVLPILLIVDDVQWMDLETLSAISFVARRLQHDRVLIIGTTRPTGEAGLPADTSLHLQPLDPADVGLLAGEQLGRTVLADVAEAIARATGGNPLAVIETVRAAGAGIDRFGSTVDEPVEPGELIRRAFARRLADLPPDTRSALVVLATTLDEASDVVERALGHLGLPAAALEPAEEAGILWRTAGSIGFTHPVLRSVAYHDATGEQRRSSHDALGAASDDPTARAWHAASASTSQNEDIAAELERSAHHLERQGGYLAAARAHERAARITPDRGDRARRLFEAGLAARQAARPHWSRELLEAAGGLSTDHALSVRIDYELVLIDSHTTSGDGLLDRYFTAAARAEADTDDPAFAVEVWAEAVNECALQGEMGRALKGAAYLEQLPGAFDDLRTATTISSTRIIAGHNPREAAAQALEIARSWMAEPEVAAATTIETLMWLGEFELASRLTTAILIEAGRRGNLQAEMMASVLDGHRRFVVGDWGGALVALEHARHLAGASDQLWEQCAASAGLALVHGVRGDALAADYAETAATIAREHGYDYFVPHIGTALGTYELGSGRPEAAIPHLEAARDWCERAGYREVAIWSWPADLVDAYAAAGRADDAARALVKLREASEHADRAWGLASSARLEGLLTDGDFAACFERAFALFAQTVAPFDVAKTHLQFGIRLRGSGSTLEGRLHLEAAEREFRRLGAHGWLEATQRELQGAGAAIPRPAIASGSAGLTTQESAVASCVVQGMTNKEIAAQLFVTVKTVEWHLGQIYRKFGIRSRTQLVARIHGGAAAV